MLCRRWGWLRYIFFWNLYRTWIYLYLLIILRSLFPCFLCGLLSLYFNSLTIKYLLLLVKLKIFGIVIMGFFKTKKMHILKISSYWLRKLYQLICRYLWPVDDIQILHFLFLLDLLRAFSSKWKPYLLHLDWIHFMLPLLKGRWLMFRINQDILWKPSQQNLIFKVGRFCLRLQNLKSIFWKCSLPQNIFLLRSHLKSKLQLI